MTLMVVKVIQKENGIMLSAKVNVKKLIKHIQRNVCKEDYAWNPSKCISECNKGFQNGEYLRLHMH